MKSPKLARHAQTRGQQRAVSLIQIRLLQEFGDFHYQKGRSYKACISKKSLRQLRRAIDKLSNVVAIIGEEDDVITVIHQTRSIRTTEYIA